VYDKKSISAVPQRSRDLRQYSDHNADRSTTALTASVADVEFRTHANTGHVGDGSLSFPAQSVGHDNPSVRGAFISGRALSRHVVYFSGYSLR